MAKITVLNGGENDPSPFLRGILVQSLVNAGLSFAEAYELAQNIRTALQDVQEISGTRLRERVADKLEASYGKEIRQAYASKPHKVAGIIVHTPTRSVPFSAGILAHSLEACGITPEVALQGARKVHARLQQTGHREIDHKALRRVIYRCLYEHCSPVMAERYFSWCCFENSGDALIILVVGGHGQWQEYRVSGTGLPPEHFPQPIYRHDAGNYSCLPVSATGTNPGISRLRGMARPAGFHSKARAWKWRIWSLPDSCPSSPQ